MNTNTTQQIDNQIEIALQKWRVQTQTRLMTIGLIFLLPAIVHTVFRVNRYPHEWLAASLLVVLYLGLVWLNFQRKINVQLRGSFLLFITYLAAVITMARGGLAGDGRIYLFFLPVFGVILINLRSGQFFAFLSALTYVVFGLLAHFGVLERWLIIPDNPVTYEFWFYGGLVFIAFLGITAFLLIDFGNFLIRTLIAENKTAEQLREAHQLLDQTNLSLEEKVKQRTSELAQANQRLYQLVNHDSLTGLPNRTLFFKNLDHSIIQAQHHDSQLAVLFIDVDNFKKVNDTYGHLQGDRLLDKVADCLQSNVRESDTVARLSGDEFAIIIEELSSAQDALFVVEKLISALSKPFRLGDVKINLSASIGVSIFPLDGHDSDTLVNRADSAMYQIKHTTKGDFQFYSPLE